MMVYAHSTAKDHIMAKQNVFLPQVKMMIHNNTHSKVEGWRHLAQMKLNEPGRQKIGRQKSFQQAKHAKL